MVVVLSLMWRFGKQKTDFPDRAGCFSIIRKIRFLFINIVRLINVVWLKTVPRLKTRRG